MAGLKKFTGQRKLERIFMLELSVLSERLALKFDWIFHWFDFLQSRLVVAVNDGTGSYSLRKMNIIFMATLCRNCSNRCFLISKIQISTWARFLPGNLALILLNGHVLVALFGNISAFYSKKVAFTAVRSQEISTREAFGETLMPLDSIFLVSNLSRHSANVFVSDQLGEVEC